MYDDCSRLAALTAQVESLATQVSRLAAKIENPEHQKYSVEEACQRLRKSRSSFYRLREQGLLEVFKEGGRAYTTEAAILRCERRLRNDRLPKSHAHTR